MIYQTRCVGCGREFEWSPRESENETPPKYHGKSCQNRHRVRLKESEPRACPTPERVALPDHEQANAAFRHAVSKWGTDLVRPYRCVCGKYHLGSRKYEVEV